jgi:putative ABC transport system ATP-binding protein
VTPVASVRGLRRRVSEGGQPREILRGVDLELEPGEAVALVGPSGSGKSTLLNLLGGLDLPDAGEVWLEGVRLDRLDEQRRTILRRRRIGFVFQSFQLLPTLDVRENLLLPLAFDGRADRAARERADRLLDAVGLGDRARAFPDRLSGGEQQRVAVARALLPEPALILADEPTGNLDRDNGERVLELLLSLVRERGATLLLVTHAEAAARRADRVLELEDGRLRADPRPAAQP